MLSTLFIGAVFVAMLANPANIDEIDCDAVQVAAQAFLEEAKREQFAVERGSTNYGEFFSEMQKVRKVSWPKETVQTLRDGLACEAAKESPDWPYMAALFIRAARGEADDTLTPFAEQFIADTRTRIKTEVVERGFINTVESALYYLFFVKPGDAKRMAKKAIMPDYWTGEDRLDAQHPNKEMLPYLQLGIVFAFAALTPSDALPILRDLQKLTEKSSDALFHVRVNHNLRLMTDEMERRINGEAPQGMSMYYLDYRGPGAPVIRN